MMPHINPIETRPDIFPYLDLSYLKILSGLSDIEEPNYFLLTQRRNSSIKDHTNRYTKFHRVHKGEPIMRGQSFRFLWLLSFLLIVSGSAFAADIKNSRLMPEGKIVVSQEGKNIAEYSREMPVPEGALLTCQGKCAVKLDDMLLVAEDLSQFSIDMKNNQRILNVQKGIVYFGLSTMPRTVVFLTPDGAVSADRVFINASSGTNMLEGYVKGSARSSELGVLSGGSMPLMTSRGVKALKPGDRFVFAQADMGEDDVGAGGAAVDDGGGLTEGTISAIVGGTVAAGGMSFALITANNKDDADGSPSTP